MPREEDRPARGRRLAVAVLTLFIGVVGVGVPAAIVAPVPAATAEVRADVRSETTAASPVFPDFGSSAVGVSELDGVLATSGPQKPRPIASITKVVTALVVLEAKPLTGDDAGPTITLTQKDVDIRSAVVAANGSSEPVQAGWRVSERAALETMLIPSANNYATTLAIWAYGSVPAFLTAARAYLTEHGLDDTSLYDANGLSERNTSTPTDLVELGRLALAEPVVAAIVAKSTADEPNVGRLDNTNELLGTSGVNGIKTGTYTTGANLLFSAEARVGRRTVQIIGVILGAKTHDLLDARVPALLKSVRKGLHDVELGGRGVAYATYTMKWGGVAKAVAPRSESILVWGSKPVQRRVRIADITGGPKGERVGSVTYTVAGRTVTLPLVLDREVLAAPVWWRLTNPLR